MPVHLKLAQFEGPLELLLSLIEERKLDITRLSLAEVAEQYVACITDERRISLENLAAFLVIASRLILLKSKMLLPTLDMTEEEEEWIEDLETRLAEYKRFKDASTRIGEELATGRISRTREKFHGRMAVFSPPKGFSLTMLRDVFRHILEEIPEPDRVEEAALEEVASLEEKIAEFQIELAERAERSFHESLKETGNRMEIIVSFLAILELVKQRLVIVEQPGIFSDIRLVVHPGVRRESGTV